MKYIAIVHKDVDSDYGVTLPDFPGCFATVKTLEDINKSVQEAVELWAEGEDVEPPVAYSMDYVKSLEAAQDGMLCLVDIHKETLAAMLEAEELSRDPNAKRYTNLKELFADLNSGEAS